MRATSKLLALALTAALQPAMAGTVPLTFEDISLADNADGYVKLADRYIKDGIEFTDAAWAVISKPKAGCGGKASFVPRAGGGCNALLLNDGDSFTLKFSQGFISGTTLFFSTLSSATITLYSEENATGKLAAFDLPTTGCAGGARFCNWELLTLNFSDVARSMVVTGLDQELMLDDFSFVQSGTTTPTRLPEPASLVLAFSALGALGWARKRAAR